MNGELDLPVNRGDDNNHPSNEVEPYIIGRDDEIRLLRKLVAELMTPAKKLALCSSRLSLEKFCRKVGIAPSHAATVLKPILTEDLEELLASAQENLRFFSPPQAKLESTLLS